MHLILLKNEKETEARALVGVWWAWQGGGGRKGGGNGWGLGSPGDITLVMLLPQPTGS